ncbi:hypothetical protein GCM10010969_20870 [Saccharibacillus kuerlensis]|uniref:Uncharacterized protein n=1 Tax=Saccharibacillus kuerlensis TaxID=459527 RepID=A0ABQ2L251_9BACL|nr:hypothetical protein GCM10010969_20870 [Saccharibacillus kuerlensis]
MDEFEAGENSIKIFKIVTLITRMQGEQKRNFAMKIQFAKSVRIPAGVNTAIMDTGEEKQLYGRFDYQCSK